MFRNMTYGFHALIVFYLSLSATVSAASEEAVLKDKSGGKRKGYAKGELMPVSCLNRTAETGQHITDDHGNLQYIPFPTCKETDQPLSFAYGTPQTQTCTIDSLPDELYHLIEFFVHDDVPLTCRVPTYPLTPENTNTFKSADTSEKEMWTPFTVALQGTLQKSHLHLHTNINVLFHTSLPSDTSTSSKSSANTNADSYLLASTAYSVPNTDVSAITPIEGTKVIRYAPLPLVFNVGWIDGTTLPGMVDRPVLGVKDHNIGFSLLSFFALAASMGVGAMGMLVYERRKSGRGVYGFGFSGGHAGNGLLGGNVGGAGGGFGGVGSAPGMNGGVVRNTGTGYGGYGGYGGYNSSVGKRD